MTEEVNTEEKPTEKRKTWLDYKPEEWVNFIKIVGDEIVTPLKEGFLDLQKTKVRARRNIAYPVYGIISLIFIGVTILASQNIIDGQSVTFFAGTLVGYLLAYLGGFIGETKGT